MKSKRSVLLRNNLSIVLLLCTSTITAVAQTPSHSRRVDNEPWSTQDCMARARLALQRQGYRIDWTGNDAYRGSKGANSAFILCEANQNRSTRVNVIVASNAGAADSENSGLWTSLQALSANSASGSNTPVGAASNGQYMGCWKDDASRVLNVSGDNTQDMTNSKCTSICQAKGLPFAATEFGTYCFCGSDYQRLGQLSEDACNVGCSGNPSEKCGGSWANSVYSTSASSSDLGLASTSGLRSRWDNIPNINNARYMGCWKDDASRVLNVSGGNAQDMTNDKCTSICRTKGLPFAATEYGSYCFCGSNYQRLGRLAESECSVPCTGNSSQKCGGSWANSVYALQ